MTQMKHQTPALDGTCFNGHNMKTQDIVIPKGKLALTFHNVITGKKETIFTENLIVTTGKNAIADGLRGNTTNNKGIITYCAVGTGETEPNISDTELETELFRKEISVRSVDGNTALFEIFFTTAEANGALKEAGLFGDDASGVADSGTLFCRTAIDRTKSTSETLTIHWYVTIG